MSKATCSGPPRSTPGAKPRRPRARSLRAAYWEAVLALDPNAPFVKAVSAVRAGDASIDHAVDVLLELEARHRIAVHDDFGGLATIENLDVWRLRAGQAPLPLGDLVGPRWRVAATAEAIHERYDLTTDDLTDTEYSERMFPFLSDTQLLLSGMDFANSRFLTLGEEIVLPMTGYRRWSYVLADWSQWSGWAARQGRELNYAHFYSINGRVLEGYDAFAEIVFACLRRKTIRLVGPELPPWSHEQSARREWKFALWNAGKPRILALLAPLVLEVLAEVRDEDLGDPRHLARYGMPRARAASAARAVEALRTGGPQADLPLDDPGNGLLRPAAARIAAARTLVRAMTSKTKLATAAMQCLDSLAEVRP
ncbi:MAG: hypothetical protein ACTHU0_09880, partial [Kofleriaceae bacterium]